MPTYCLCKVSTNCGRKVSSQSFIIMQHVHDDARNQRVKLYHLQIVCAIFFCIFTSSFSFLQLFYMQLFALFVFISSLDHLHIWFGGHCMFIFTSLSSHLLLFVLSFVFRLSTHLVYWLLCAHLHICLQFLHQLSVTLTSFCQHNGHHR